MVCSIKPDMDCDGAEERSACEALVLGNLSAEPADRGRNMVACPFQAEDVGDRGSIKQCTSLSSYVEHGLTSFVIFSGSAVLVRHECYGITC